MAELLGDVVADLVNSEEAFASQPVLNASHKDAPVTTLDEAVRKLILKPDDIDLDVAAEGLIDAARYQVGSGHINFSKALAASESELQSESLLQRADASPQLEITSCDDNKVDVKVDLRAFRRSAAALPALQCAEGA